MTDNIDKFKKLLADQQQWPMLYYFKFIIQNKQEQLDQVKGFFEDPSTITYKTSKDIKFIGISCKQWMPNPESIVAIYEKASQIKGLISL